MKKNELFCDFVVADIRRKLLIVTSETAKRSKRKGSPAAELIADYSAMYPFFKLVVDDTFYKDFFTKHLKNRC